MDYRLLTLTRIEAVFLALGMAACAARAADFEEAPTDVADVTDEAIDTGSDGLRGGAAGTPCGGQSQIVCASGTKCVLSDDFSQQGYCRPIAQLNQSCGGDLHPWYIARVCETGLYCETSPSRPDRPGACKACDYEADPEKLYVSKDVELCKLGPSIRCPSGQHDFHDACGCGCRAPE